MVEGVEHVRLQLYFRSRRQRDSFGDRDVQRLEARTDDGIAFEISEAVDRYENRRVEPLVDVTNDADRSSHIGTDCIRHSGQSAVARHDVQRAAALELEDRRNLPVPENRVWAER